MSLCDKCYAPGQCCKRLRLYREGNASLTFWLDEPTEKQLDALGLPFKPTEQIGEWLDEESGRRYGEFLFTCPRLLPNGRCGDYENRPDLCRRFEPGADPLCVHFQGAEGVDLVAGL